MFPFKKLKVLELASVLAGPAVGQFFAELGAEVLKVENEKNGGDVTRSWKGEREKEGDRSAYFCSVNWGKKSIALDLSSKSGKEVINQLVRTTDVVIASYKPGDGEKLGVDYKSLSLFNASLIYGQITGYGSNNHRVGYDAVIQAEAGFMDLNGEPNGPPTKMPVALVDILAAHQLKEALLIALLNRQQSGEGAFVEVSLIQAAISSLANQASNWLIAGQLPMRLGSAHPNIAPYGESFETSDGKLVLLAVGSDKQFDDLCTILGLAEVRSDPNYSTNQKRVVNRDRLKQILNNCIRNLPSGELMQWLHEKKIPSGTIQNLQEVFGMSEAKEILLTGGGLIGVRTFVARSHDENEIIKLSPPPHLGEHTKEVLQNLGVEYHG
jgi:crotonobetainyl-CoA:carnitine CoA-transferase CaiB-like acyl-CoA transferase